MVCRVDDNVYLICGYIVVGELWMYIILDVMLVNWFDVCICCFFGFMRDVFFNDLVNLISRMFVVKF